MKLPTLPSSARSLLFRAYLTKLATSSRPIVLGPWRSELGFEILYWLPLLQWAFKTYGINQARCVALSRGGMGHFYPAAHQVDLYTLRTVDQVRLENQVDYEQRKILKQTSITPWDLQVAQEASDKAFGAGARFHLLHPSWMYWLFEGFWEERDTVKLIATHCDFSPLPVPSLPEGFELPKKFIAVRFYDRHTFPLNDPIKAIVTEMVQGLASKFPVVLLNQPTFFDDHADLPMAGENIFSLPAVSPETNFVLQAAVLARASAFVGTYGGVAQWALRYQKPSLSFYAQFGGTAQCHRTLSEILAARTGVPYECCDLRALRLWQAALGPVVLEPETVEA